jgi:HD-GYP domain-containing protein (c-di-GMP phosphodiesterase class II)
LSARIFSVVDVWDALSSNRPYRAAWPANQVIDYIDYQSNKQFEPEVTRAFLDLVRSGTVKGAHGMRPAGGNVILR